MFAQQYVDDQELPTEMVSVVAHAISDQIRETVLKLERGVPGSDAVCIRVGCIRVGRVALRQLPLERIPWEKH